MLALFLGQLLPFENYAKPLQCSCERVGYLIDGNHILRFSFNYDGGGIGKGATSTLFVDGNPVAEDGYQELLEYAFRWMKPSMLAETPVRWSRNTEGRRALQKTWKTKDRGRTPQRERSWRAIQANAAFGLGEARSGRRVAMKRFAVGPPARRRR